MQATAPHRRALDGAAGRHAAAAAADPPDVTAAQRLAGSEGQAAALLLRHIKAELLLLFRRRRCNARRRRARRRRAVVARGKRRRHERNVCRPLLPLLQVSRHDRLAHRLRRRRLRCRFHRRRCGCRHSRLLASYHLQHLLRAGPQGGVGLQHGAQQRHKGGRAAFELQPRHISRGPAVRARQAQACGAPITERDEDASKQA